MWIFTTHGFVSIVEKASDRADETLTVRARNADALEAFARHAGIAYVPEINLATDYPYRRVFTRGEVSRAIMSLLDDLRYTNFKDAAKVVGGYAYASVLSKIWSAGWGMTPDSVLAEINTIWDDRDSKWKGVKAKKGKKGKGDSRDDTLGIGDLLDADASRSIHSYTDAEWDALMREEPLN